VLANQHLAAVDTVREHGQLCKAGHSQLSLICVNYATVAEFSSISTDRLREIAHPFTTDSI